MKTYRFCTSTHLRSTFFHTVVALQRWHNTLWQSSDKCSDIFPVIQILVKVPTLSLFRLFYYFTWGYYLVNELTFQQVVRLWIAPVASSWFFQTMQHVTNNTRTITGASWFFSKAPPTKIKLHFHLRYYKGLVNLWGIYYFPTERCLHDPLKDCGMSFNAVQLHGRLDKPLQWKTHVISDSLYPDKTHQSG